MSNVQGVSNIVNWLDTKISVTWVLGAVVAIAIWGVNIARDAGSDRSDLNNRLTRLEEQVKRNENTNDLVIQLTENMRNVNSKVDKIDQKLDNVIYKGTIYGKK